MSRYSPDTTAEERELIRKSAEYDTYGSTGSTVGGAIGGGLGLLAGALTGGAALPVTPALMGIGSAIGGLIGSNIGSAGAQRTQDELFRLQEQRNKPILEQQARDEAFKRLLSPYARWQV